MQEQRRAGGRVKRGEVREERRTREESSRQGEIGRKKKRKRGKRAKDRRYANTLIPTRCNILTIVLNSVIGFPFLVANLKVIN